MPAEPVHIKSDWDPREKAVGALTNILLSWRGGAYKFVHRGAVNWMEFDWQKYPLAASIFVDESALWRVGIGLPLTISLEVGAYLPDNQEELDASMADTLYRDARGVFEELLSASDPSGNSYVLKADRRVASAQEWMDATRNVQGIVVTVPVEV